MKAQVYTELQELYPAVATAAQAVQTKPNWWAAYQTLGRAQLNLGEIYEALRTFQKSIHLKPDCIELWEEDLLWTQKLLRDLTEKQEKMSANELSFAVREAMRVGIT